VKIDYAIRKTAKVRIKFSYVNFLVRIIICVCVCNLIIYMCAAGSILKIKFMLRVSVRPR